MRFPVSGGGAGGVPGGAAGGDLAGTYPNPTVIAVEETSGPTRLTIGAIAVGQKVIRTGTTLVGAADTSPPSGAASGDLAGTYPGPSVAALTETSGPQRLVLGAIAAAQRLVRIANTIVGQGIDVLPFTLENGAAINWTTQLSIANGYVTALATFTLCPAADVVSWPVDGVRMLSKENLTAFGMALAVGGTQTINGGTAGVGIALLQGSTLVPSATQTAPMYFIRRASSTAYWVM